MERATDYAVGVSWVHPSWRDLVIEHLMDSVTHRRRFIKNMGTDGLILALSTRGGQAGDRNFPLLQTPDDFTLIEEAALRISQQGQEADLFEILSALNDTLSDALAEAERLRPQTITISRIILNQFRIRWDNGDLLPMLVLLNLYYEVSELAPPLLCSPRVDRLWNEAEQRLREFADMDVYDARDWCEAFDSAAKVGELIENNEPRFARMVDYPRCLSGHASALRNKIEQAYNEFNGPQYIDMIELHIEEFNQYYSTLLKIEDLMILDDDSIDELLVQIDSLIDSLKDGLGSLQNSDDGDEAVAVAYDDPTLENRAFSIDDLFLDL